MIKLVVFDFDGVIEDTYEMHYLLNRKKIDGLTREEHKKLFEGNAVVEREKLKHRHTEFDLKKAFEDYIPWLAIKQQIRKTLINLGEKYSLGIISTGSEKVISLY